MKTVLCYGDSNTYGYDPATGGRYDADTRWPCVLGRILGDGYEVGEEGCNGRTTVFDDPDDDWKIGLDYIKGIVCSHRPVDILVIMLGSNDMKICYGASCEDIAEGMRAVVKITAPHLHSILHNVLMCLMAQYILIYCIYLIVAQKVESKVVNL